VKEVSFIGEKEIKEKEIKKETIRSKELAKKKDERKQQKHSIKVDFQLKKEQKRNKPTGFFDKFKKWLNKKKATRRFTIKSQNQVLAIKNPEILTLLSEIVDIEFYNSFDIEIQEKIEKGLVKILRREKYLREWENQGNIIFLEKKKGKNKKKYIRLFPQNG
jgi:hypothetical protein